MIKGKQKIRDRILDVAEKTIAEYGYEGVSMRDIVNRAKVNLATVYYYFDSKDGLLNAALERRFGSIYKEQKDNLRVIQESPEKFTLEQILEALLLPPLKAAENSPSKAQIIRKLIGRIIFEHNKTCQETLKRRYKDLREGYLSLIHRAVPHLKESDLQWRLEFIFGAQSFLLINPQKLEYMSNRVCNPSDTKTALKQMICFFAAGLRAPSVSEN